MIRRHLWLGAGGICFVLGWIGLVVPMMPGFVFLLGAVFCFARSNPVWERWMLDHPHMGPALNDWLERRAIARSAKRSALVVMALSAVMALWLIALPWSLVSVTAMAGVSWWLWTRPE